MLFVPIGVINRQTFFHQLVGSMCSINFLGGLLQFDVDIVVKIFRKDTGMKKNCKPNKRCASVTPYYTCWQQFEVFFLRMQGLLIPSFHYQNHMI